jgi:hypothetical protein
VGQTTRVLTLYPTLDILQLHRSLPKPLNSLIVQMRTGKIGPRQLLCRWRVPGFESAECECGQGNQTVRHVLLACPTFKDLKEKTMDKGRTDLKEILNTPRLARKAASFMIRTKLLGQFGAVPENDIL